MCSDDGLTRRAMLAGLLQAGAAVSLGASLGSLTGCVGSNSSNGENSGASTSGATSGGGAGSGGGVKYRLSDPASLPARLSLPVHQGEHYLFLPVKVEGTSAGTWLLDTGSAVTLAERGVARRLGFEAKSFDTVHGIGGTNTLGWVGDHPVSVGGVELNNRRLGELNLYALNRLVKRNISGIVGYDAFTSVPITFEPSGLDGERYRVLLHRPSTFEPHPDDQMMRLMPSSLPMLRAEVGRGVTVPLIVDTGQDSALALPWSLAEQHPWAFAGTIGGSRSSVGIGGVARTQQAWIKQLTLFGVEMKNEKTKLETAEVTRSAGQGVGRIGMGMIRRFVMTLDARGRKAYGRPVMG